MPKESAIVSAEANAKQKTSPETSTEIHNWIKLYHAEVERRKKLQTDLIIERDRNKQMHLQLQIEKKEKSKLCQQIGGLLNKLSNQRVNIYQNFRCSLAFDNKKFTFSNFKTILIF